MVGPRAPGMRQRSATATAAPDTGPCGRRPRFDGLVNAIAAVEVSAEPLGEVRRGSDGLPELATDVPVVARLGAVRLAADCSHLPDGVGDVESQCLAIQKYKRTHAETHLPVSSSRWVAVRGRLFFVCCDWVAHLVLPGS